MGMVAAWWQADEDGWAGLCDQPDPHQEDVARALTAIAEHLVERMAAVGGVSTGEMLHRLVGFAMPRAEATPGTEHPDPLDEPGRPGRSAAAGYPYRLDEPDGRSRRAPGPAEESPDSTGQGGG